MQQSLRSSFENQAQYNSLIFILRTLCEAGYQAFIAGGAVRDAFLGRSVNDIDIATNALPEQVLALFKQTVAVGKSFGVVIVQVANSNHIDDFEVATFRREEDYRDGRTPSLVIFENCTISDDASRRDFTMNAMFYDLFADKVMDFHHGLDDLKQKLIRAVGNAELRFREDHLRILRALRFSAQLGFEIELATKESLDLHFDLCLNCSRERISQEMLKILVSDFPNLALSKMIEKNFFEKLGLHLNLAHSALWLDNEYWTMGRKVARVMPKTEDEFKPAFDSAAWILLSFLLKPERQYILQLKDEFKLSNRIQIEALVLVRLRELLTKTDIESPKPQELNYEKQNSSELENEFSRSKQVIWSLKCGEILEVVYSNPSIGFLVFRLLEKYESNPLIVKVAPVVANRKSLPAMTVKAIHLKGRFFAAKLGEALRHLYWIQLYFYFSENKELSVEDLMSYLSEGT